MAKITGAAATSSNNGMITTVDVANTVEQIHELQFTLRGDALEEGETGTYNDIVLFGGVNTSDSTLPAGVTFESDYFESFADMQEYYKHTSTNVPEITIMTDDTDNYLSNLIIKERIPTGEYEDSKIRLSKYRQSTGVGFNEVLKFPAKITIWPNFSLTLSKLQPGSEMTFIMQVQGWNKVQRLSALQKTGIYQ